MHGKYEFSGITSNDHFLAIFFLNLLIKLRGSDVHTISFDSVFLFSSKVNILAYSETAMNQTYIFFLIWLNNQDQLLF